MLCEFDLREYQLKMVDHIIRNEACALWVDCGLGKTVSALTAVLKLQDSFDVHKVLVVGPKRVANKVWTDEVEEWAHLSGLKVSVMIGTPEQRIAAMHAEADIYCINRENVAWLKNYFVPNGRKLRFKWPWDMLIIDESSSFKHQSSERWKALRKLRKFFTRVVELTGTPASNGYINLWAQIALLDRGQRLGHTEKAFRDRWMNAPSKYDPGGRWEMKPGAKEQIQKILSDIVISMDAEDYLELPPVMINPVRVTLSKHEMAKYQEMAKEAVLEMEGKVVTALNAGVLSGKLLQLANGAIYHQEVDGPRETLLFHDQKTEALMELLETVEGPALVAYNFKSDVERLAPVLDKFCKKHGKTWRVLKNKQDEDDWNADKIDILLLHPDSAGHGLNMHKGSSETIIWYGLNWSLELWTQLNARLAGGHRRIGKNVVIHVIMAEDTVDELVVARLESNHQDQQQLLDAMKVYKDALLKPASLVDEAIADALRIFTGGGR